MLLRKAFVYLVIVEGIQNLHRQKYQPVQKSITDRLLVLYSFYVELSCTFWTVRAFVYHYFKCVPLQFIQADMRSLDYKK